MEKEPKIKTFQQLNILETKVRETSSKIFDKYTKDINLDLSKNSQLASQYYEQQKQVNKNQKKVKRLKVIRWFLLLLLIFPFFIANSSMKKTQKLLVHQQEELTKLQNQLDKQISPLISKININNIIQEVINTSWQDVQLLKSSNYEYFQQLEKEYIQFSPKTSCVENLTSGKMFNHPFMIFTQKLQEWIMQVYTNSLTISYTSRGMNGQAMTSFETVVATYTHPAPKWSFDTKLIYKSSFAPNLFFTTNCSKKEFKKINKNQSPLENNHFNKLCKIIRNNETDIRVVFTPLAQENYVQLLSSQDYWITKDGNLTIIDLPKNNYCLDSVSNIEFSYNIESWKNNIIDWLCHYIKTLCVFSLPIANLPIYYQMSEHNESMNLVPSILQVQNDFSKYIKQEDINFSTEAIYEINNKEIIEHKKEKYLLTSINCNYFNPIHKTKIVPTGSFSRGIVNIPVDYIDYQPETQTFLFLESLSTPNKTKCFKNKQQLVQFLNN